MKKHLLILALLLVCPAVFAGTDCPENSDACAAEKKKLSPFIEASRAEKSVPQVVPAPAIKRRAAVKPADAAPAVAAPAAAAPSVPPGRPAAGGLSNPSWLLLVFAGFAGLYLYLRGGANKRRRK